PKCQQGRLMLTESTCQVVRETRVPVSVLDWWNGSRGDDAVRAGGIGARRATHARKRGSTPVGPRLAEGAIRPSQSNIGRGPAQVKRDSTNADLGSVPYGPNGPRGALRTPSAPPPRGSVGSGV